MAASHIDIGGVEYITDSRLEGGKPAQHYFYDINALSNFVADGPSVIGFDPFARLADLAGIRSRRQSPFLLPSFSSLLPAP